MLEIHVLRPVRSVTVNTWSPEPLNRHLSVYHVTRPFVWLRMYCTFYSVHFDLVSAGHSRPCRFDISVQPGARLPFAVTKLVRRKCKLANSEKKRFNLAIFSLCPISHLLLLLLCSFRNLFTEISICSAVRERRGKTFATSSNTQKKTSSSSSSVDAVNLVLCFLLGAGARPKLKHLIALFQPKATQNKCAPSQRRN